MKQKTAEWLKARTGMITGSRIGGILGVNPFSTREDVMREMVRQYHGADPEFTGNNFTQFGNDHEVDALDIYKFLTGYDVTHEGFKVHPKYDYIGVSPDGLTPDGGIEFKCPFTQKIPTELPKHYYAQVQLSMEVYDVENWPIFYWTPTNTKLFPVKRDKKWWADSLPKIEAFHKDYLEAIENPETYLAPIVEMRTDTLFINAASAYQVAKRALDAAQGAEKDAREYLLTMVDKTSEGGGIRVSRCERKGNVNYKAIDALQGIDLDEYRAKSTVYFSVKVTDQQ